MATTPEGKVKAKVKARLKELGAYQFWPVQTGRGAATLDCLGGYRGVFFAVETKKDSKSQMTARQRMTATDMIDKGLIVAVVYDSATLEEFIARLNLAARFAPPASTPVVWTGYHHQPLMQNSPLPKVTVP